MYFCYGDESGNDNVSPALVMVGIVVDATKLRRTQEEFDEIFSSLCQVTGRPLKELKSSDLLPGKNAWNSVDGVVRRNVVTNLCDWVGVRSHKLALSALDRGRHSASKPGCSQLQDEWQAAAMHVVLQLQRHGLSKPKGKGRTVIAFDNNPRGLALLSDLVYEPPAWVEKFYERGKKEPALSQIIDTPLPSRVTTSASSKLQTSSRASCGTTRSSRTTAGARSLAASETSTEIGWTCSAPPCWATPTAGARGTRARLRRGTETLRRPHW